MASSPVGSSSASVSLPAATVNTTDAAARSVLELMNAALLTPAEVGTGFTKTAYTPPDPKDTSRPLPCGGTSTAALFPNALRTGTNINKGDAAQFQESVSLYLDAATATRAFDSSVAGLACSKGTVDGTPVTISAARDVTAEVGGDKALAWTVDLEGDPGLLVAVRSGSLTLGYTFLAAAGTDTTTLPSTEMLVKKATAKVLAKGLS